MDFNSTLDAIINNVNTNQDTLRSLLAQLQHTTITSSDDALYQAPILDDSTGIWTLAQTTANVDGEYVGCYKLPVTGIDSYISSITVVSHSNPASPAAPASVTPSVGSTVDLTAVLDLEGQTFNSFCIRSATPFEINLTLDAIWCSLVDFELSDGGFTPVVNPGAPSAIYGFYSSAGWTSNYNIVGAGNTELRITKSLSSPAYFTHIKITYVGTTTPADVYTFSFASPNLAGAASATVESDVDITTDNLRTDIYVHNGSQSYTLKSIEFHGIGTPPSEFSSGNC